ncbi:MAG: sigma-70 family RNA polymerase sigma factor, partial [Verrucomicrobiae bacterium]|nr:sigma-70 family RNA polymerase sigma factor [Verrucomicrobiae bacterium]
MTDNDSSLSDESLARLARNGDLATFEVLVRRYEGRLYRFSLHWCGNESDARDLVQEIFVAAYLGLPGYKPSVPFASWLFTIARNKCIDKSRCRTFTSDTETEAPEMASQDTPASLIEQRDDAEYLWRLARLVLTNTQFQSLWLHYVE